MKLSEKDFQRWVIDTAQATKWQVWHVPAPMRHTPQGFVGAKEAAGLPDLILTHHDPPRLVFAEVKGTDGRLKENQLHCLQSLKTVADYQLEYFEYFEYRSNPDWEPLRIIGVYVWNPGMERPIEALLKTRILT